MKVEFAGTVVRLSLQGLCKSSPELDLRATRLLPGMDSWMSRAARCTVERF
jgi:hypothetical protein